MIYSGFGKTSKVDIAEAGKPEGRQLRKPKTIEISQQPKFCGFGQ